jgi:hypothetical protein
MGPEHLRQDLMIERHDLPSLRQKLCTLSHRKRFQGKP